MLNLFKPKQERLAMSFFKKRNGILRDFITTNRNIDEHVLATEVVRNTATILTILDPKSPVDEQFISEKKKEIVGKFMLGFASVVDDLNRSGENVVFANPKKVYKKIYDDKWVSEHRDTLVGLFDIMFDKKVSGAEANSRFETFKEESKLNHPLEYTSSAFISADELKFRLMHTAALAKDRHINWDMLYLYLASIDTFEDFENIISLNSKN